MGVEFRILGPLEVLIDGVAVPVGGPRQRALLATLLLSANQVVSRDRLIEEVSGDAMADTADHALRVQVSRLRKVLSGADGIGERLVSRPPGYLFRVGPGELDLYVFEQRLADGRLAIDEGELERAASLLREAESMWRGRPLADLEFERFVRIEVERLEELRLAAVEERIDVELELGRQNGLVPELEALVAEHPLRERLRGQLMLALYRCGRQVDALEAYRAGRTLLSDQLALEPGRALRALERSILNQDPDLDLPTRAGAHAATAVSSGQRPPARAPAAPQTITVVGSARGKRRELSSALTLGLGLAVLGVAVAVVVGVAVVASSGGGKTSPSFLEANSVGAISPEGGGIRAVVPLGTSPQSVAAGEGAVWVSNYEAGTVSRIDASTRAVVDTVPAGLAPTGIAVGAGMVWVANNTGRLVSKIDPAVNRVVQKIPVGSNPNGVAVGEGSVWVANTNSQTLTKINPVTGAVTDTISLGVDATGVAAGLHGVWVSDTVDGRVLRVDPQSDQVTQSINVGRGADAITVGDGSVWVANSLDGTVSRIDPDTNAETALIRVGEGPAGMAVDRRGVWVANQYTGTISRIDLATNTVARTINVGNRPSGIALASGLVWVGAQAQAATSHRGGTLTVLTTTPPGDLDPTSDAGVWPLWWGNDGLTAYKRVGGSESAQVVPDLAAWLPSPTDGGKTYTFQLRRGIRYSTGAPVRPGDFRRALERDLKLGPNPLTGDYFANVIGGADCIGHTSRCDLSRGVVVNDQANTVTFHLVAPNPEFLDRLALADADAVPAGIPDRDIGLHPIPATGPYAVARITHAETTLVRNPYFHEWSRAARPDGYPDRIVLRTAHSASAEITAVEQGSADVATDAPPPDRLPELQTRFASQVHTLPALYENSLILNTRAAPFDDVRVRRALNYAVDRAAVARLVGAGGQPTCQTLTPWFTGYDRYCPYTLDPSPSGVWREPDLTTAKRLIAASHTRGTPVTIWTFYGAPAAAGRYLAKLLARLGYPTRIRDISTDPKTGYARIADSRTKSQAFLFTDYAPYPKASQLIEIYFGCRYFIPNSPLSGNIAEFCDPRLDAQIQSALAAGAANSQDAARRWAQADRTVTDDAPLVPLVIPNSVIFVSKRVGNYEVSAAQGVLPDQLWVR